LLLINLCLRLTKTLQLNSTLYLFETLQHFRLSRGISSFCKPFLGGDCSRRRRPRSPWRGLSSDDPRQDRTTFSAGSFMFAIKPSAPTKEASGPARSGIRAASQDRAVVSGYPAESDGIDEIFKSAPWVVKPVTPASLQSALQSLIASECNS